MSSLACDRRPDPGAHVDGPLRSPYAPARPMIFPRNLIPLALLAGLGVAPGLAHAKTPPRTPPHAIHAKTPPRTPPPAIPGTFPVDSVRAGMVGVGLTVFEGTRIDSFQVSILGVLRAQRPGATLILARAQGPFLE